MTDAEIVATWMEPNPDLLANLTQSKDGWWWNSFGLTGDPWQPAEPLTLDRLREVEARLDASQCVDYDWRLAMLVVVATKTCPESYPWHASAEQKLAALAEVLRAEVEDV